MRVSSGGSTARLTTPGGEIVRLFLPQCSAVQGQVLNVQIRPRSRDGGPRLPSKVGLSTPGQSGEHDFEMMNIQEKLFISTMIRHNVTIFIQFTKHLV